jgi:hypothetical protein
MRRKITGLVMICLFALTLTSPPPAQATNNEVESWDFDVYLNDKKVGKHSFTVAEADGIKLVQSEANFKYKILFIPAYRYEHTAAERWTDNCLVDLSATTNDNGERILVTGSQTSSGFAIQRGKSPAELPECVMTFAYWNPEFLEQPRLLNPQTGEYVDISVEKAGSDILQVRGQQVPATRFRLTAYDVDLTLWYSPDDEWLALESVAKGGHIIRYELS